MRTEFELTPVSSARHPAADDTDWTGSWVCVGLAEQLTEVGAVLPATIGHHAAHVRRTDDGLVAALNARPFGGCLSVPVHCGSTRNVKCPHRACAFSEDGGVLDDRTDPDGTARAEFVGRREVNIPLAQWGSMLFVNVTMRRPPPLAVPDVIWDGMALVATGSQSVPGSWLCTPARTAARIIENHPDAAPAVIGPNLFLAHDGSDALAVYSRPAGKNRSTVLWAVLSRSDGGALRDAAARVWGNSRETGR
jgi:nitrite reductase/ring-hydroxylating ferredoxin subunit